MNTIRPISMAHAPRTLRPGIAIAALFAVAVVLQAGCGRSDEDKAVTAHVSGTLALSPDIDPEDDGSGFEVLVLHQTETGIDTLGQGVTVAGGTFAFALTAPERGIYPLVVHRGAEPLAIEELVVADGDSVTVRGTFPLEGRALRIVSYENGAWAALRNAKASFQRSVMELMGNGTYSPETMAQSVAQTANLLWTLRDTYPNTMGAIMGEAESIGLLESWNDSLALARFGELQPDHPAIVDLVRAARRSTARISGQEAALALVERYAGLVDEEDRAGVRSELVIAHMDSSARDQAMAVARELSKEEGQWAEWAGKALYELENLQPGMAAPAIGLVDVEGRAVNLDRFRGNVLLLEFFAPSQEFLDEAQEREAIVGLGDRFPLVALSISLEPDTAYTQALLEVYPMSGTLAIDPAGSESAAAKAYNVNVLPTRVLIDPDGRIVGKYAGSGLDGVRRDLAGLVEAYAARQ